VRSEKPPQFFAGQFFVVNQENAHERKRGF
jgi:hypothetical protein